MAALLPAATATAGESPAAVAATYLDSVDAEFLTRPLKTTDLRVVAQDHVLGHDLGEAGGGVGPAHGLEDRLRPALERQVDVRLERGELGVGAEAAEVEVLLDGRSVATLDAPPWRLDVDLGEALVPHELLVRQR